MFFAASKVVWFVLTPSNLLVGLALLGVLLAAFRERPGRAALRVALGSLVLLAILGFGPVGSWLLLPLEERFPKPADDGGPPITGLVVLGGAVRADLSFARGELNVGEAGERVIAMADLSRRHPAARIVFSGGSGNLLESERPEAEAVLRYAGELGLDPARITVEAKSRTTWENAVESKALAAPKPGERWLLVTSAWHMPRAVGLPEGELSGRPLSGRLPDGGPARPLAPPAALRSRAGPRRRRRQGMARAPGLSSVGTKRRAAARSLRTELVYVIPDSRAPRWWGCERSLSP